MSGLETAPGGGPGRLAELQRVLGASFSDPALLERALVHSSYVNENPGLAPLSNERLEFLGDAVIGVAVAEQIYREHPDFDEGKMTRLRAALVRRETLARVAAGIGLGDHLYLGKGEESSGGRLKPANLASALEAVVAAVFLDRGLSAAAAVTLRLLRGEIKAAADRERTVDFKSELQHVAQLSSQETPVYLVVAATGAEHRKTFTVEVSIRDRVLGHGSGRSKKAAEAEAARDALAKLPRGFTT